ncbi:segregation and condensation protein A [Ihubacter sp. rT4E-8]|uniref:segregation and condensation protein A n=1 Tax=unclassified Ihubacter TaxID=2633299 RepID=UPI001379C9CC
MSYKVRIETFEGPFDLLVYLIENAQMNIYDIQISEITRQYMAYIETMRSMDIGVATEFMVLAATLIDIKSKMILPRYTPEGETLTEEDPRSELVERLLEYKKYKQGAEILREREEAMEGVYEKPQEDISQYVNNPEEQLDLDIGKFAEAFHLFLRKKKREEDVRAHYTRIEREKATIETRMVYIKNRFMRAIASGIKRISLRELIPNKKDRYDVVVTFVSVLQMMRDKYLDAEQAVTYGEITVLPGERKLEEETLLEQ